MSEGEADGDKSADGGADSGAAAAADAAAVASAARWASTPRLLADLLNSGDLTLPGVVRLQRGPVLLVAAGRKRLLVGQPVKLRPGRAASTSTAVGPRLAIPDTYPGWFELLSEDGRAGRCVGSVAELARRPQPCLVRAALRATAADASCGAAAGSAVLLRPGDTLTPVATVGRFLRASTGSGTAVLLPLDARARLLPLAGEHNISGAHCARTLLAKRLPLTARLLHGASPRPPRPELRLLAAFQDELVLALPLAGAPPSPALAIPAGAGATVVRARNHDALRRMPEFRRLAERGTRLLADAADRIVVLEGACRLPERRPSSAPALVAAAPPPPAMADEYDEIDQIYAYVRGFAPLPKSLGAPPPPPPVETIPGKKPPPAPAAAAPAPVAAAKAEKRSRAKDAPTARLFVKNGRASAASRVLRPKAVANPVVPATPPSPPPPHAIFGIRYKSMSNIHGASVDGDHDGTVDSSLSGGGAGSGGAAGGGATASSASTATANGGKTPEKARRLSRPRSLTNLVWGTASAMSNGGDGAARLSVASGAGQRIGTLYL